MAQLDEYRMEKGDAVQVVEGIDRKVKLEHDGWRHVAVESSTPDIPKPPRTPRIVTPTASDF